MLNWEYIFYKILLIGAGLGVLYLIAFFFFIYSKGRIQGDNFTVFNIYVYLVIFFTLYWSLMKNGPLVLPAIWFMILLYRKIKYKRWI